MALPGNILSTTTAPLQFEAPRNLPKLPLEDWDKGGVNIENTTQGLLVYDWRCFMSGDDIRVEVPGVVAPTTVHTRTDIVELAFTWDRSMRPFLAWQLADNTCQFRWYDSLVSGFVVTNLPTGSVTPRCQLDDKRTSQSAASDIILAYVNSGELRYRQQRDRYTVERVLSASLGAKVLRQIGLNRANRFQFRTTG